MPRRTVRWRRHLRVKRRLPHPAALRCPHLPSTPKHPRRGPRRWPPRQRQRPTATGVPSVNGPPKWRVPARTMVLRHRGRPPPRPLRCRCQHHNRPSPYSPSPLPWRRNWRLRRRHHHRRQRPRLWWRLHRPYLLLRWLRPPWLTTHATAPPGLPQDSRLAAVWRGRRRGRAKAPQRPKHPLRHPPQRKPGRCCCHPRCRPTGPRCASW